MTITATNLTEIDVDGCPLAYATSGAADAPVLLLSHALGATADLWAPQIAPFSGAFRVIRYDTRGHGRSGRQPGSTRSSGLDATRWRCSTPPARIARTSAASLLVG